MNTTHALFKETLRMNPPGPFTLSRRVVQDHTLGDLKVYKHTAVRANLLTSHFNEKYFEDPFTFKPERFLAKEETAKIDPFAFLPFSAGPRNCIG